MKRLVTGLCLIAFIDSGIAVAKDGRLRCRANGAEGREAELRFEDGELRAKWEIDVGAGQVAGDEVAVAISGIPVGKILLDEVEDDQLEGDFRINGGFPAIRSGTKATVGSLKCVFRK